METFFAGLLLGAVAVILISVFLEWLGDTVKEGLDRRADRIKREILEELKNNDH